MATRQHGVVAGRQLARFGFGEGAIEHWLRCGRIHRLHRGVYAVGHRRLTIAGRRMAAVLAGGPGAVLSHRDAAACWGIRRNSRPGFDVTAVRHRRARLDGIHFHSVRRLDRADVTLRGGIPITTLARTLLDLAEVVRPADLGHAIEEAERLRLFDLRAVEDVCARGRGRHGLKPLRAALERFRPVPHWTRSDLEREFLRLCDRAGIPRPATNLWIDGHEVDAYWAHLDLIVELDTYRYHGHRAAFERDRRRSIDLRLKRHDVIRVTDTMIAREPLRVADTLRRLLATLPAASGRSSVG